jgi:hypothetical protein
VGALSGSDEQPNAVRMALSDTPKGQGTNTGAMILKPPPVEPVAPWPDGTIAPVTVLAALLGELIGVLAALVDQLRVSGRRHGEPRGGCKDEH